MADASMTPVRDTNGKITGWSVLWREKDGRHHPRVDAVKGATVPPNTTAWFLGD